MTKFSLGQFAAHLLTFEADLHVTEDACVEKACRMIEKEAKAAIPSQTPVLNLVILFLLFGTFEVA
jgi:hypothetical protein